MQIKWLNLEDFSNIEGVANLMKNFALTAILVFKYHGKTHVL